MKKILILLLVFVTLLSGCVSTHGLPEAVGKPVDSETPDTVVDIPETTDIPVTDVQTPQTTESPTTDTEPSEPFVNPTDSPLFIRIEDTMQTSIGLRILFTIHNETGYNISFGWVGSCHIEVTTTEGTYYYEPFMLTVSRGTSQVTIDVNGASGEIRKLVITDLRLLNENGLPGRSLTDVVVYDISTGVTYFEGSFEKKNPVAIIALVAVILVAAVIAPIILIILLRKNRKSVKSSDLGQSAGGGEMQFTPPPTMNNAAHQQFMQQEIIRQHMDFAQKSVTPIDQGGFVPPPPPPSGF